MKAKETKKTQTPARQLEAEWGNAEPSPGTKELLWEGDLLSEGTYVLSPDTIRVRLARLDAGRCPFHDMRLRARKNSPLQCPRCEVTATDVGGKGKGPYDLPPEYQDLVGRGFFDPPIVHAE